MSRRRKLGSWIKGRRHDSSQRAERAAAEADATPFDADALADEMVAGRLRVRASARRRTARGRPRHNCVRANGH